MQDAFDPHSRISNREENNVVPMRASPKSGGQIIAGRMGERHPGDLLSTLYQFLDETSRPLWVVSCDVVTNFAQIGLR